MTISRLRRKVHVVIKLDLPVRAHHGVGYQFCEHLDEVISAELVA